MPFSTTAQRAPAACSRSAATGAGSSSRATGGSSRSSGSIAVTDSRFSPGPSRLFTGETIHPWHFDIDPALRPLRETAELLARRTGWPALYDPERLAANQVPVAAAVYHDDMYVDTEHSLRTAAAIRGLRTWVTNEYEHDGVRTGGPRVLDRLLAMVRDEV
ncbi:hypothetical protein SMICM304S_10431 [Streptomyces microflavus]